MANPFLVLGGIAVGVVTATFGILQVPGWVASAQDASAINDLSNIVNAQAIHQSSAGMFSASFEVLSSGKSTAAALISGGGGGFGGGIVPASLQAEKGAGTSFALADGVKLSYLGVNDEGTAFCAVVQSASGNYFAGSEATPISADEKSISSAMDGANCQITTRGEHAASAGTLTYTYNAATAAECLEPALTLGDYEGALLNARIDWGDGTVTDATSGVNSHSYATADEYEITITGTVPHVGGMSTTSAPCLTGVTNWDENVGTVSADQMLSNTSAQLTTVAPLPSTVTTLANMFSHSNANPDIAGWNTSAVTNMARMFYGSGFNSSLAGWDTSNVTDMSYMFSTARSFNQPLNHFKTGNVTTTKNMFADAYAFNRPLNSWDTSKVKDMSATFSNARAFNGAIGEWDTSSVTTMADMLWSADAFNQPIGSWNTSNVADMSRMLWNARAFNQPIGGWDTSQVTDMNRMFGQASSFNQPLESWKTLNVENMQRMFEYASSFNQPLAKWDTSKVQLMYGMFNGTDAFSQNLSGWGVGSVSDISDPKADFNGFSGKGILPEHLPRFP